MEKNNIVLSPSVLKSVFLVVSFAVLRHGELKTSHTSHKHSDTGTDLKVSGVFKGVWLDA